MPTKIVEALDRLFENKEKVVRELEKENPTVFNSQQFLRKIIHENQHAYIDLLVACQHLPIPFDQAHQQIGGRLLSESKGLGYEPDGEEKNLRNIFDRPTAGVKYCRIDSK